MAVRHRSCFCA